MSLKCRMLGEEVATILMIAVAPVTTLNRSILRTDRSMSSDQFGPVFPIPRSESRRRTSDHCSTSQSDSMRVPDIANRNVVATEVNLDIPEHSEHGSQRRARIAATLKGDFVIRRDSPWIVDANGNAPKLLALGAWHGLIRPSGRV